MNEKALFEVKDQILAHPELHDMDDYFTSSLCGTQMCIAGQLAWNAGWRPLQGKWVEHEYDREARPVMEVATEILGVNGNDALRLFHTNGWPVHLEARYDSARNPMERARVTAMMIDHFIITQNMPQEKPLELPGPECCEACRLVEV